MGGYGGYLSKLFAPLDDPDGTKEALAKLQQQPPAAAPAPPPMIARPPAAGQPQASPQASMQAPGQPSPSTPPAQPQQGATVSTVAPPTGPNSARDAFKASLSRQQGALQSAEKNTADLQSQPDEATALAPLESQRATAATPLNPNDPQYQRTKMQKLGLGLKSALQGLGQGGILGAGIGAATADYKSPNREFGIDQQKQQQNVASIDSQIGNKRKSYEDETGRAKGLSQEERANATGENDVQKNANTEDKNDETYHSGLAKAGLKETTDAQGNTSLADDPDSEAFKSRQQIGNARELMGQAAQMRADIAKQGITPGTPAWNLKQQQMKELTMRGQAMLMNAVGGNKGTDLQGNALPGAMLTDSGQAVGSHFQSNVRPTGTERTKADLATSAKREINTMQEIVQKHPEYFGPGYGQNQAFQKWVGTQDPDAQRFRTAHAIAGEHAAAMFGSHSKEVIQQIDSALGSFRDNPKAAQAAMDEVLGATGTFSKAGTVKTVGSNAEKAAQAPTTSTEGQPPKAMVDGMKEGQYIHGPGGSYQKKGGQLVKVNK